MRLFLRYKSYKIMAKRITDEDLRLNLIVNGDGGRKEMLALDRQMKDLQSSTKRIRTELKNLEKAGKTGSQEHQNLTKTLKDQEKTLTECRGKYNKLRDAISLENKTLAELRNHLKLTQTALSKAVPGTENWKKLNSELQLVKARLSELRNVSTETKSSIERVMSGLNSGIGSLMAGTKTISSFLGRFEGARDAFLAYDEAMTDAMKTTGLTKNEISELSEKLKGIDTKTAQNELLGLVRAGGKLGISGQEDLLGFAKAANQINVALSEDLGGDAEAAITEVGKMVDVFNLKDEFGIEKAMLKVGSAINELGAASTANEGYIVNFSGRLAGIAPNAKISIDKVMGLAATLDSLHQRAETSSTAVGQTITKMFEKTETFANIAGMSLKDFSELLNNDVNEAFIRVLEGMNKGGDGGMKAIGEAMRKMGLNGSEAIQVLGSLSKQTETLRQQQLIAAEAFNEGTSITNEYELKNNSLTATLEKQKKALMETTVEIGEKMNPVLSESLGLANLGLKGISGLIGALLKYRIQIAEVAAAIFIYNQRAKIKLAYDKLLAFWSNENRVALMKQALSLKGASASTAAFAVVQNLLVGNVKAATVAVKAFWTALKANPLGLIIAVVTAVVVKITSFVQKSKEATKEMTEMRKAAADTASEINREKDAVNRLKDAVTSATIGSKERAAAIKQINDQYGSYLPHLLDEKASNDEVAAALGIVNDKLSEQIRLKGMLNAKSKLDEGLQDSTVKAAENIRNAYNKTHKDSKMSEDDYRGVLEAIVGFRDTMTSETSSSTDKVNAAAALKRSPILRDFHPDDLAKKLSPVSSGIDKYNSDVKTLEALYGVNKRKNSSVTTTSGTSAYSTADSDVTTTPDNKTGKQQWSLSNDEAFLKAKAELTKQFNEKEIASQGEYDDRIYELEVATLTARLAAHKEKGADRAKIENELQEKIKKHSEDALKKRQENEKKAAELTKEGAAIITEVETDKTKAAMDGEEVRYQAELKKFKETQVLYENQAAVLEAIEKKHQNKLFKIAQDGFDRRIATMESGYKVDRAAMTADYSKQIAAERPNSRQAVTKTKERDYALLDLDLKHLEALKAELEKVTADKNALGIKLSQEDLAKYNLKLEETKTKISELTASKAKSDGGLFSGTGKGSLFGVSQEEWNTFFANIDTGKNKAENLATALNAIGGLSQEGFQLASKAIELTNAKENKAFNEYKKNNEKKKKDLKSRYDAGLVSQEQYNARVEEMEAEEEAKREEMEIKQAKRTKALNLVQSIINTALSVTKTLAQWGWPAGAAPAAIVAAFGAAQTALIAAQPVGAEEGGFVNTRRAQDGKAFKARLSPDKRGFVSSPTVLVGENGGEYVIPADGLSNPTLLPFVATMEEARKAGTLKSLNFEAVYPVGAAIGRESGGFTGTSTSSVTGSGSATSAGASTSSATDERLLEAIELLNKRLSVPIKADVSMLGKNGIIEQTEKYNRAKRRGTYGR
nr:MAG TPA: tail tape measure protein [Caudoviricetes sp.]